MYRSLPFVRFSINGFICIVSVSVLNFIEITITLSIYGFATIAFAIYSKSLVSHYFDNDQIMSEIRIEDVTDYCLVPYKSLIKSASMNSMAMGHSKT